MMDAPTSLEMMQDPMKWPLLVLPVKRRGWEVGIMVNERPVVYLVNLYDLPKDLATAPKAEYTSLQGVVDDGWAVD